MDTSPVRAQIEGERQARDLARRRDALAAMGPMVERGQDLISSRKGLDERLGELGGAMNVVQLVAGESGLPGIPRAVATGNPRVDNLLRHMVVDADKGVLLRDRGLADLLGKTAGHVNEKAGTLQLEGYESQPVEIVLDQIVQPSDGRGRTPRYYAVECARLFLDRCADAYLPAPREELKAVVVAAFEHFETRIDTNPFRQRSRRLAKAQAANLAKAEGARLLTSWPGPYRVFTSTH
ncbi:MAG TPA: hypothetical protein PKB11_00255 [Desulfovibrio sp.]|uniref:hypothetical protein n=1 Tax=Desulfovibrio sp. TaxID=885 RepID=UPI002C8B34A1|nr:hypothetical protein [Desulfovibrio sp.]HMM37169.1 hypothetical protein [Desulfovibrio sp.]